MTARRSSRPPAGTALEYVSRYMIAATIAHEDAQLPTRFNGLDWDQWWDRALAWSHDQKDPYGSPIPEQLSKNLLLYPSPDHMSLDDAYQLMGVLPSPVHAHRLPGGGIDMNPATYDGRVENYLIPGARRWVPIELARNGGWQKLMQEMGITGQAHNEPNGPDSCRTMLRDIRELIASGRS